MTTPKNNTVKKPAATAVMPTGVRNQRPTCFIHGRRDAHVRRDLPQRLSALKAQYPGVDWLLIEPIGEHAEVIETIARVAAGAATFGS